MIQLRLNWALVIAARASSTIPVQTVGVPIPASPPTNAGVVNGNFLGVSFELSAFGKYCEFIPDFYPVLRDRVLTLRISTRAVTKSVRMGQM